MRRAARILFHLAAGVSGVLFLVAVGFWVASYRVEHRLTRAGREAYWDAGVSRGDLCVERSSVDVPGGPIEWSPSGWRWKWVPPSDLWRQMRWFYSRRSVAFAGFFYGRLEKLEGPSWLLVLPIPFLLVVFAFLPLADVILIRRRRGRRLAAALCVSCGYDLRATPDRCPECGTVPPTKAPRLGGAGG